MKSFDILRKNDFKKKQAHQLRENLWREKKDCVRNNVKILNIGQFMSHFKMKAGRAQD